MRTEMVYDQETDILNVVRNWLATRERIVQARAHSTDEAALFQGSQGTHLGFLKELGMAARALAGALDLPPQQFLAAAAVHKWPVPLPSMAPQEQEAFRELAYSWASELSRLEKRLHGIA